MRRRAAVLPVIGHLKNDHRMCRNYLKGRDGDRINAVLAVAGYNFSLALVRAALARPDTDHLSQCGCITWPFVPERRAISQQCFIHPHVWGARGR